MRTVTKDEFFAFMGDKDVHPRVDVSTLKERHFVSNWELPNRVRIGRSKSDSWGVEPTTFELV